MNSDAIMTFLAIVDSGNVTEAANHLFISQGAASMRIQQLEEELGITLLYRKRGMKSVQITPEGERFYALARQWRSLEQQAHEIGSLQGTRELRIAAADTFNTFIFPELYATYAEIHPRVKLYIQTEHSAEIHQLIESQEIDIGFAFTLHASKNVYSRPLYREDMVVLCHGSSPFARSHDLADLNDSGEILATISPEFEIWHKRHFPTFTTGMATIGTNSMLPAFLENEEAWCIVSRSVAMRLVEKHSHLVVAPLGFDTPQRIAYLLYHRNPKPWVQELADDFLAAVESIVEASAALEPLFPTHKKDEQESGHNPLSLV